MRMQEARLPHLEPKWAANAPQPDGSVVELRKALTADRDPAGSQNELG